MSHLLLQSGLRIRERTLSKISSDTNISEDSFFGFESDGTPIWSSVVNTRAIESKSHHFDDEGPDVTHHTCTYSGN